MVVLAMLCLASALLFGAVLRRRQPLLLMGVVLYAATCLVAMELSPELLWPALSLSLGLAVLGLVRFLLEAGAADDHEAGLQAYMFGGPDDGGP